MGINSQNDSGVLWQLTGYRPEVDVLIARLAITPEELPATTEDEFFVRFDNEI